MSPAPDPSTTRGLSAINLLLPVLFVTCAVGARKTEAAPLDRLAPVLFWLWLAGTPPLSAFLLVRARAHAARRTARLAYLALGLWAIGLAGALLLH